MRDTLLVALSKRLLGCSEGAEDLVQDAATLALRERSGLGSMGRSQARAWLATTVRNLASNARRRRGNERYARMNLKRDSGEGAQRGAAPSPDDVLAKAEYRSRVAALVLELPEAEQRAVLLRYYEGKSSREIQDALGAPSEAAVRQLLSRGVARLRKRLTTNENNYDWKHAALVMTSTAATTQTSVKSAAVAAAVLILGGAGAGGWWLFSTGTEATPQQEAAAMTTPPSEAVVTLSDVAAAGTETRVALDDKDHVSTVAEASAPAEFRVQLLDGASEEPLAGHAWFMIETGRVDNGRSFSLAGEVPNPKPLASGVTDAKGFVVAPLPEYELVNLCTQRTATHARGSWPIRVRNGVADPTDVALRAGGTIQGRVVDDQSEPMEGVHISSRTFFNERVSLGVTDADGGYSIPRSADFPRSFVLREDDEVEPNRTLPTKLLFTWSEALTEEAFESSYAGYANVLVGDESVVHAADVVLPRFVSISGRVVDEAGTGIEGALITESSWRGFAEEGDGVKPVPPASSWAQPEFSLAKGQSFTQGDGRYAVEVPAANNGRRRVSIAAYSPGGDIGHVELNDVMPGGSIENVNFMLKDAKTVRLRIVLPREAEELDPEIKSAKLIWDLPNGVVDSGLRSGTSLSLSFAAEPVIEACDGAKCILIPRAHQPDREARGGTLSGTIFLPGFQPQHFELASGVMEADLPLEPLPQVRLRLEVGGEGAKWLKSANITVTPEAPDPTLSVDAQVGRYGRKRPIRTMVYGWKNDSEQTVDVVVGDRPVYAYVELFGDRGRPSQPLPPFGPIPLLDSGDEDAFVLSATLDAWPNLRTNPSEDSSTLKERRPSVVTARIVSDVDGSFLVDGKAQEQRKDRFRGRYSDQLLWKGEERTVNLELYEDTATLTISHPTHYRKEIGPLSLKPGTTTDLGEIRLEPLLKIPCRLEHPDGAPVGPGYVISGRDPEVDWVQIRADAEGRFDLPVGRAGPTRLFIKRKEGSSDPPCESTVEVLPDGSGRIVIPKWRPFRVRITGLDAPYCYGVTGLRVRKDAGLENVGPSKARFGGPQLDGTDLIFHGQLPPGLWTFLPAKPAFASFPPITLEVDPAPPGSDTSEALLQITIQASLTE